MKPGARAAGRRVGRFVGFRAIPFLVILLGLLAVVWSNAGTRNTTQAVATAIDAPITVIDVVENIPASSMEGLAILPRIRPSPYPNTGP